MTARRWRAGFLLATLLAGAAAMTSSSAVSAQEARPRTFNSAKDAVEALIKAARTGNLDDLLALFGAEGRELIASSDPATARGNRDIFVVAAAERWRLVDDGANRQALVIGNEEWPFPVPLVKEANRWRFDATLGKEEVVDRRIGRNELAVIDTCHTYVAAQRRYAQQGHDGKPAGLYAKAFRSDTGKQNGLYWPVARGEKRSPLGDLVAQASQEGRSLDGSRTPPPPFHGYYFKILTGQGPQAADGEKAYVVSGEMSGGFGLVAWPAQYDASGVMTFIISQAGTLYQKDLGPTTTDLVGAMTTYNPDASWSQVP